MSRAQSSWLSVGLALLVAACCSEPAPTCPPGVTSLPGNCPCTAPPDPPDAGADAGPGAAAAAGEESRSDGCGGGPQSEIVVAPTKEIPQSNSEYCWAAVAQILTAHFTKNDIPQCAQASAAIKYGDGQPAATSPPPLTQLAQCCPGGASSTGGAGGSSSNEDCQKRRWPSFPLWSEDVRVSVGCLPSWCELREQVRTADGQHRPFAFTTDSTDDGGHMLALLGFAEDGNGTHLVLTYDPAGGGTLKWDSYEFYRTGNWGRFEITGVFDQLKHVSPGMAQGAPGSQLGKDPWFVRECGGEDPAASSLPPRKADDRMAAEDGRKIMGWLGAQKPSSLGFRTRQEAGNTELGNSLPMYSLSAAAIEALEANPASEPALEDLERFSYSVRTLEPPNPGPRSRVIVAEDVDGWYPFEYGTGPQNDEAPTIDNVDRALSSWPPTKPLLGPNAPHDAPELLRARVALVHVPALNVYLLYDKRRPQQLPQQFRRFTMAQKVLGLPEPGALVSNNVLFRQLKARLPKTTFDTKALKP